MKLDESHMETATTHAREAASATVSWIDVDDPERIKLYLQWIDECAPEVWYYLPEMPNLSGEMADSHTPTSLLWDVAGCEPGDLDDPEELAWLCDEWETAVCDFWEELVAARLRDLLDCHGDPAEVCGGTGNHGDQTVSCCDECSGELA